jgi:hypothetical protein
MKIYNLTINNGFRNPLRWGRCPINIGEFKVWGVQIVYKELVPCKVMYKHSATFYYGEKYKTFYIYKNL